MAQTNAVAQTLLPLARTRISGGGFKPVSELLLRKKEVVLDSSLLASRLCLALSEASPQLANSAALLYQIALFALGEPAQLQIVRPIVSRVLMGRLSTTLPAELRHPWALHQIMVYAAEEFAHPVLPPAPSQFDNPISAFAIFFDREIRIGRQLICDLGGEFVSIKTGYTATSRIEGFYFHPDLYRSGRIDAYAKWRCLFRSSLAELAPQFSVKPDGVGMNALFGLPTETSQLEFASLSGVVLCPDDFFELHPGRIIMHLQRRQHVFVFNYDSTHASVESTCLDAFYATKWMQGKLSCQNHQLFVCGHGLGCGPAAYVAAAPFFAHTQLILDTPRASSYPLHDLVARCPGPKLQVENDPNFQITLNEFFLGRLLKSSRREAVVKPSSS